MPVFDDLIQHKAHANAALLKSVRDHQAASRNDELRKMLHHILVANRYWVSLILARPFDVESESQIPDSLDTIAAQFHEIHQEELDWIAQAQPADLDRMVESPYHPGAHFSTAQVLMQVCMHSHGHRAQCATMLRALGGTPPPLDFIVWLKERL
jgi:uncharacterized damage-inducible protein DinB